MSNVKKGDNSSATTMGSGIHGASRLRFVGMQDLGGNLKANFWLEMQPNLVDGSTGSALFNRGAWAGLSGNLGEVRLGRMGTNTVSAVCDVDQMGCYSGFYGGGLLFSGNNLPGENGSVWMAANPTRGGGTKQAGASGDLASSTAGDSTRYVRAIRYSFPAFVPGLGVNVSYASGQSPATGGTTGNSTGLDFNYTMGNLKLTGAFQKADADQATKATGKLTTLGGVYNFGFMSLGAITQSERASGSDLAFTKGSSYALTALFPMGATTPYVKVGQHKYSGGYLGDVTTAKVSNVGVRYALSKSVYLYGDYVINGAKMGTAAVPAGQNGIPPRVNETSTFVPGSQKSMTSAGLVYNF